MNRLFIFLITLVLSFLSVNEAKAFHIVGGEVTYECVGDGEYVITLTVYRDCAGQGAQFDDPAYLHVFDGDNDLLDLLTASDNGTTTVQPNPDICVETLPNDVCVEGTTYTYLYDIPPGSQGPYTLAYQRYSRNENVDNIVDPAMTGSTYFTTIPDESVAECNNSPVFEEFPPIIICANSEIYFDHSAFDEDGDSLSYSLCTPFIGGDDTCFQPGSPNCPGFYDASPPYDPVNWIFPYGEDNMLGGSPPLEIDPVTGILTGLPDQLGQYVVGVCVTEYKNGIPINTVNRDFQFNISECTVVSAILGDDIENCAGDLFQMDPVLIGVEDFQWTPTTGLSDPNIPNPIVEQSGTYALTVENEAGCQDIEVINIEYYDPVEAVLADTVSICRGEEYVLDASASTGAAGITWDPEFWVDDPDSFSPTIFLPYSETFIATVYNEIGCQDKDTIFVNVVPIPEPDAGDDVTICLGESVELIGGGGNVIEWGPAASLDDPLADNPIATPTASTTYTLTVGDDTNLCFATDEVTVIVLPPTPITISGDETLCIGNSTTLSVEGGVSYTWEPAEWLDDANSATPVAMPPFTTTFTVSITDENDCTYTEEVLVTVEDLPELTVSDDNTICSGESIPLEVSGGGSYTWSPAESLSDPNSANPTASPTETTTYTVISDEGSGCEVTKTIEIEVLPATGDGGDDLVLCGSGDSGQLNASGGFEYSWSPATGLSDTDIPNPTATPSETTTYTVSITGFNDCVTEEEVTVFYYSDDLADAGDDVNICEGDQIQLSASGGNDYSWSPATGLNNTGVPNPIASPTETTTYTVEMDSGPDCTASSTVTVFVAPNATADVGNDLSVCEGQSVELSASGGDTYSWSPVEGLSDPNIANPIANPSETTTYTVTVSNGGNCEDSASITVDVNGSIDASVSDDTNICDGGTTQLLAIGGDSYEWSPAEGLSATDIADPIATPIETTTYTVTISNGDCTQEETVTVTVGDLLVDVSNNAIICTGESVQLSASGGDTYSWFPSIGLSANDIPNPVADPDFTVNYVVTITSGNCEATEEVTVEVAEELSANAGFNQTICSGEEVQLNATGGANYSWSPSTGLSNTNIPNPMASPTETTTYTVTTSSGDCEDSDTVTIEVSDLDTTISDDVSICEGENAILNASGGTFYSWTPIDGLSNPNASNPVATPNETTTYTVLITSGSCEIERNVTVEVTSPASANAGDDLSICLGEEIQLNAEGGTTYSWANDPSLSDTDIANPMVNPSETTTYTVTVNPGECEATDEVTVVVEEINPDISNNASVCEGGSAQLFASGGTNYSWEPNTGLDDANIANPIATPSETTTYTVTISNDSCEEQQSVTINVDSDIVVDAGNDVSILAGQSTQLIASGGTSYSWSPAAGLSCTDCPNPIASPDENTTYTVVISDGVCEASDQISVSVVSEIVADAGDDISICFGESVELNANGGSDYAWTADPSLSNYNIPNPIATPTETTTYTVTVSNGSGIDDTDQITVFVEDEIVPDAGSDVTICEGALTELNASGGENYSWSPADGLSDTDVANPTAFPTETTTYTVSISIGECVEEASVTVEVAAELVISAGDDTSICANEEVPLNASGGVNYTWSPADGLSCTDCPNPIATPSETTTYTVSANSGECEDEDTVVIEVNPAALADAGEDVSICAEGSTNLNASGGDSYSWEPADGLSCTDCPDPIATPTESTLYTVTIDNNGCIDQDIVFVNVSDQLTPDAGQDQVVCTGEATQLIATGGNDYSWSPATGLSCTDCPNPIATPDETTIYTVTASDGDCSGTDNLLVVVASELNADAGNNTSICANGFVELSASGGSEYSWSPAEGLSCTDCPNPIATPSETTTYSVIVSSGNCDDEDSVTVLVEDEIIANAGQDVNICEGTEAQLNASGGGEYLWSPAEGLSCITCPNPIATPSSSTLYTVTVDNGGCIDQDIVFVNISDQLSPYAGQDQAICTGEAAQLNAVGGTEFNWSPPLGLSCADCPNPIATPNETTVYTVTVSDGDCFGTDEIIIEVADELVADAGSDVSICDSGFAQLEASGGSTYNWEPSIGLSCTDCPNPIAAPDETTTYTVTVSSGDCSDESIVSVIVADEIIADAGNDLDICEGTEVQLNASGGGEYLWSPIEGLSCITCPNPLVSPTETTTYTVTISSGDCEAEASVTVTINSEINAEASEDASICEGEETQLNATGGSNFSWSPSTGLSADDIANPIATPDETTTYYVTVGIGDCASTDSLTVEVLAPLEAEAGDDLYLCDDESIELNASGGDFYFWEPSIGLSSTNIANPIAAPSETTTYYVTVFSANSCEATDSVTVFIVDALEADAGEDVYICIGEEVQLQGSGGTEYSWEYHESLSDLDIANPTATPTETTTYFLTTSSGNCEAEDALTIFVISEPSVEAGEDTSICGGEEVSLEASSNLIGDYSWSPTESLQNANSATPIASPTETTTYYVTFNSGICEAIDSVTIEVTANLSTTISDNTSICTGESVQLSTSGGSSYEWSPSTGLDDDSIAEPTASPEETTTYTVLISSGECTGEETVTIEVNDTPTIDLEEEVNICLDDVVELNPNGAEGDYTWSPPNGLSNANVVNPIASPEETTTYYATISNGSCEATDSITVVIGSGPNASIVSPPQTICAGESIELEAQGGVDYFWYPNINIFNNSIATPTVFPTETTTYYVDISTSPTCFKTDSIVITVTNTDDIEVTEEIFVCAGESAELSASGGLSYDWQPTTYLDDHTSANPIVTPESSIVYYVTIEGENGCEFYQSVFVNLFEEEEIDAGNNQSICPGESVELLASGGNAYNWSPAASLNDDNIANPMATPTETTTYTVVVSSGNDCIATDQVTISVNPIPEISAGEDQTICFGEMVELEASGGVSYQWSPVQGLNYVFTSSPEASPEETTLYTVTSQNEFGCESTAQVLVEVLTYEDIDAGNDVFLCEEASATLNATGGTSYNWYPATGLSATDIPNPIVTPTENITYFVDIVDANECSYTDSLNVYFFEQALVDAGPDVAICGGGAVNLFATGGNTYEWSPTDGLSDPTIANPMANPSETTTYTVNITSGDDCTASDSVTVTVNNTESNPGVMPTETQFVCAEEFSSISTSDSIIGDADALAYVLHTSPTSDLGEILATNTTGEFAVDTLTMQYYQPYYVSAVSGPTGSNPAIPDLDGECLKVNEGTPVIFLRPIKIDVYDACIGPDLVIFFVFTGGYPGYDESSPFEVAGTFVGEAYHGLGVSSSFNQGENQFSIQVNDALGCEAETALSSTTDCAVLPIELIDFEGQVLDNANQLNWWTANEINADYFTLERSSDGFHFEAITQIEAKGNSTTTQAYEYIDTDIQTGDLYYRLVLTDEDGTQSIPHGVILLSRTSHPFAIESIYPIPADDELQLIINAPDATNFQLKVYDYTGRLVMEQSESIFTGSNALTLPIQSMAPGTYILSIENENHQLIERFVKY